MISLIASVERSLAKECSFAIFTAVVDFPTPVAPAINTRIGGRPNTGCRRLNDTYPSRHHLMLCPLANQDIPQRGGFEAVPPRIGYGEQANIDCW